MARRDTRPDPKEAALARARCLNPHPEQVTDPEFLASDFFDARDAVQVKYEMVRKVRAGGVPVTEAAAAFGYSRPAYYAAAAALESSGLDGLVPARPGPRGASKLTEEILAWAEEQLAADPVLRPAQLPDRIADAFGVRVHPRVSRASAGPPPGAPLQKPLTCPPPQERRMTRPCPCSHHLATRLLNRAPAWMPARTVPPAAGWTPATSSFAMPPCTRAPRRSRSGSAC
jgi:transposase